MFNTIQAFEEQFTRVEGGYLLYPSRKSAGKLVTEAEYEQLSANWQKVAGRGGRWKVVGAVLVAIALWTLLAEWLSPPEWGDTLFIVTIVAAVSAWLLWASTAPLRLVKGRSPAAPPRSYAEAQRAAMAVLNWPFVAFAVVISGAIFSGCVTSDERTASKWLWLIGSGVMFALYLWIALKKLLGERN